MDELRQRDEQTDRAILQYWSAVRDRPTPWGRLTVIAIVAGVCLMMSLLALILWAAVISC